MLITAGKRLLQRCPLANIAEAVRLLEALDQLTLFEQMLNCLKWLQSGHDGTQTDVICRALLIVAYAVYELPSDGLYMAVNAHKLDLCQDISSIYVPIILNPSSKQDLFDIAIEGLAQIWLKLPELLQDMLDSESVFETIIQTMLRDSKKKNGLYLQTSTKAQILKTLARYVQMQESPSSLTSTKLVLQLQSHLLQLAPLVEHQEDQVRLAASALICLMHDQGVIQLSESIEHLTRMLGDVCKPIRDQAMAKISTMLRSKLAYFASCFGPRSVLLSLYEH